ncbi:hypothetical protein OIU79_004564 [Salix purpurea]|uniref:Pentatricopeptide repeat-containing protein n=1 Tax=Salix purpurea TaxID=77065 RepID=A0A9Q0UAE4_SALPP|nr:hypothetical protein OIU79_004564 [Salix purpurea]
MLSSYLKSRDLSKAMREIFSIMPIQEYASWNSFISGYVLNSLVTEAVKSYSSMLKDGFYNSDRIAFSTMLMLVWSQGCLGLGRQVNGKAM